MRMWMIPPRLLCNKHLIGEHGEIHKLAGHIARGRKLGKLKQFVEPRSIWSRHNELADEMISRNITHESPIKQSLLILIKLSDTEIIATVNKAKAIKDLCLRCNDCYGRIEKNGQTII